MSKLSQVYGLGQALIPVLPPPLPFENPPNSNQTNYEIGQIVYTPPTNPQQFYLYGGSGNWVNFASSLGNILSILGTASQIAASTVAGVVTLSIPSVFFAPGSIASTGTVTAGTGLVVTTGNISFGGSGNGIITKPVTASGAASGAVVCNGRVGAVTFTSPSIAAGASQTLTMTNSSITGSGTIIQYSITGVTTGSAIGITSVTNSAGSSAVVITNGTGVTTQVGSITLTFLVLN